MTCKGQVAWELENCSDQLQQVQTLLGIGLSVEFTVGTEALDVINVAGQVVDANGDDVAQAYMLQMWLSDAPGGAVAAAAPSGGIAIGTDGTIVSESIADQEFLLATEADGDFDIDITEAGADTWYLNARMPDGSIVSSDAITFAV